MRRKLELFSIKGYLNIDMGFTVVIFFILFYFCFLTYNDFYSVKQIEIEQKKLDFIAKDICVVLSQTSGFPNNWENNFDNSFFLGLKDKNLNKISSDKLNCLKNQNYLNVIKKMNLNVFLNFQIIGLKSNNLYLSFGENYNKRKDFRSKYVCYSNYNQELVKIVVEVFK